MAWTSKCSPTLYWQDLLDHISILPSITWLPNVIIQCGRWYALRRSL